MPKKRKGQAVPLKAVLHIFCEGEKTEPNYLNGYTDLYHPGARLVLVEKTSKNTPVQLVDVAVDAKKDTRKNPEGDLFWVVFDRESPAKYSDSLHEEARRKAERNGIEIAISNVCFEVWILLHFQQNVAAYNCYDDLRRCSNLNTHIPDYDKGDRRNYSRTQIAEARKRAKNLNQRTKSGANPSWRREHKWNPFTDVYKLLDAIDNHLPRECINCGCHVFANGGSIELRECPECGSTDIQLIG